MMEMNDVVYELMNIPIIVIEGGMGSSLEDKNMYCGLHTDFIVPCFLYNDLVSVGQ